MPGIGELIEGAMQQAPQPGRQFIPSTEMKNSGRDDKWLYRQKTLATKNGHQSACEHSGAPLAFAIT